MKHSQAPYLALLAILLFLPAGAAQTFFDPESRLSVESVESTAENHGQTEVLIAVTLILGNFTCAQSSEVEVALTTSTNRSGRGVTVAADQNLIFRIPAGVYTGPSGGDTESATLVIDVSREAEGRYAFDVKARFNGGQLASCTSGGSFPPAEGHGMLNITVKSETMEGTPGATAAPFDGGTPPAAPEADTPAVSSVLGSVMILAFARYLRHRDRSV